MTRCSYCGRKIKNFPFKCRYCNEKYCSNHRLPEDHSCPGLKEYKKGNQERWQRAVKGSFPSKKDHGTFKSYKYDRPAKHRPKKRKHRRQPTKHQPSFNSKLRKFWWKNRKLIKDIIKILVVLFIIYLALQYYGNNPGKISSYLNSSITGFKMMYEDFTTPYSLPHENAINKSFVVKSTRLNKIELTLHGSVYDYFMYDAPREYTYSSYSSYSEPPAGWKTEYWTMFLTNSYDDYVIDDIVNQTIEATNDDGDIAVRTLVRFVQGIPYDWATYESSSGHVKYPYETLYTNRGVCGEKSLLLAKLLTKLGYGVALFDYDDEMHMAVGVECPYDESNFKTGYCFIEATDYYVVGKIPGNYVGGADIRNAIPDIIVISEGKVYSP
ncbi:hypothetical protein GOV13_01300 [Candidatus Pacearchaeota archaeon]|nr:hypothetical protein [Candidatus Pacearchaeota archaeon]